VELELNTLRMIADRKSVTMWRPQKMM